MLCIYAINTTHNNCLGTCHTIKPAFVRFYGTFFPIAIKIVHRYVHVVCVREFS